jgi:uncharacterized lipoprotein YddW (UPF0748 family)
MNKTLLLLLCLFVFTSSKSQSPPPKRELRGAWIATFANIDWPSRTQTPAQQRSALITILDHHKVTGINAIYFQVRSQCDAMYQSSIEPWSADLTGVQGRAPAPIWDPMQFAIDECHKRGMEFHAWINPYRAVSAAGNLPGFAASHVAKQHPEWLLNNGTTITLDPGLGAVRDYIISVITDIVKRYDVDGIHFDDYFYPPGTFNDNASFAADPRGFTDKASWRRDNVNLLIQRVYQTVIDTKPWVKFGVSPSGIYRNSTNPAIGTATSGSEHYNAVFADSKKWLEQGWVDYIEPQVYWYIGQPGANYAVIVPWWNNNANGRHIYIGMAGYKVNDAAQGAPWANNPSMIPNEMRLNRSLPNISGQSIYNTSSLRAANKLGFRDSLRLFFYQKPSLQPLMPWRDNQPPASASNLSAVRWADDSVVLKWTVPEAASNELDKVKRFAVYRSEDPVIDINDANNLFAITVNDTSGFADKTITADKNYYYTITALDHFHNESPVSNIVADVPPTIACPVDQEITVDANCAAVVPDFTALARTSNANTVTQLPAPGTVLNKGNVSVTLTAANVVGQTASCSFSLIVADHTPPVITTCAESKTIATDDGLCSGTLDVGIPVATDNCSIASITGQRSDGEALTAAYPKGNTTIVWTVKDESGNSAVCEQTITVEDREAPVISSVSVDPAMLFPANHKMHKVSVNYQVRDNCGQVTTTLSVTSNEPDNGTGDGDTENDWQVVDAHHVKLRAERAGADNGRVYTITIRAEDAAGNVSTQTVTVTVPHDHSDITSSRPPAEKEGVLSVLSVKATPNPSRSQFVITTSGTSEQPVNLRVMDNLGRVIETKNSVANSVITIGKNWRAGIYFIELSQGGKKQTLKLIKRL